MADETQAPAKTKASPESLAVTFVNVTAGTRDCEIINGKRPETGELISESYLFEPGVPVNVKAEHVSHPALQHLIERGWIVQR